MKSLLASSSVFVWAVLLSLVYVSGSEARVLPTKEDCGDFWNVIGGQGNVLTSLRKVQTKGMVADANSLLRLYEDCLRAEEGIRYRRSGPGLDFVPFPPLTTEQPPMQQLAMQEGAPQLAMGHIPEEKVGSQRIINKLRQFLNRM